jgi:hypothetical protein
MECWKALYFRITSFKMESALFENSRPNAFPLGGRDSLLIARESAHTGLGALRWMKLQQPGYF